MPKASAIVSIASILPLIQAGRLEATIRFVNASQANDNGSGTGSWANAKKTLQAAIDGASGGDEIWVAAVPGQPYKPSATGDRSASFLLKSGVQIYGGFVGTETQRNQRDWSTNVTILTGDLNGDDEGVRVSGTF